ncbi:MAG: hypothetical protein J2P54_07735 [Bradyrhizobiaceae bacterium]|nr:hypothetical protein [Bradyrhizobiaceae bacterium]
MYWINTIVQGALVGGLYALLATGLSLMFGVMRIINLAHGDFIVVSAYLAIIVMEGLGVNPLVALAIVSPLMFAVGYVLMSNAFATMGLDSHDYTQADQQAT